MDRWIQRESISRFTTNISSTITTMLDTTVIFINSRIKKRNVSFKRTIKHPHYCRLDRTATAAGLEAWGGRERDQRSADKRQRQVRACRPAIGQQHEPPLTATWILDSRLATVLYSPQLPARSPWCSNITTEPVPLVCPRTAKTAPNRLTAQAKHDLGSACRAFQYSLLIVPNVL